MPPPRKKSPPKPVIDESGAVRKERATATEMTDKQHAFVTHYIELGPCPGRGKRAAILAGYSPATAEQQACNLMSDKKYPLVAQAIRDGLKKVQEGAILKASDVLRYIHTVMTFKPVDWFLPGGDGGWLTSMEDFRMLPDDIRQIIEEVEFRSIERDGVITTVAWIRFVSKTSAMALAARHQLGEKKDTNITINQIDWTKLLGRNPGTMMIQGSTQPTLQLNESGSVTNLPNSDSSTQSRNVNDSTIHPLTSPIQASLDTLTTDDIDDPVETRLIEIETNLKTDKKD